MTREEHVLNEKNVVCTLGHGNGVVDRCTKKYAWIKFEDGERQFHRNGVALGGLYREVFLGRGEDVFKEVKDMPIKEKIKVYRIAYADNSGQDVMTYDRYSKDYQYTLRKGVLSYVDMESVFSNFTHSFLEFTEKEVEIK